MRIYFKLPKTWVFKELSGHLGTRHFTLIGDETFGSALTAIGREKLEDLICSMLVKELDDAIAIG